MVVGQISSTHPPLPPTTEDERLNWLRLLRSRRVGVATFHRLMRAHGTASAALEALPGIAATAGVTDYIPCPIGVVRAEMRAARAAGATPVFFGAPGYPKSLSDIPDPPPILWTLGDPRLLSRRMIALVGARSASSLGTRMARKLAADLGAAGFVVVSGLARGIDAAAHSASLETGTIAVLAGGVDVPYPAENAELARAIARSDLLVSEQPMGLQPQARHFPARNRIVSGLARAVVVVEAAARSGSLITARNALDQGREVLAIPGHPMDGRAAGCNMLIRDGATLVRSAEDVIDAIGAPDPLPAPDPAPELPLPAPPRPASQTPQALHRLILERLGPSPLAEDQLIRDLAAEAGAVTPALTELELDGRVQRQPGGLLSRVD